MAKDNKLPREEPKVGDDPITACLLSYAEALYSEQGKERRQTSGEAGERMESGESIK